MENFCGSTFWNTSLTWNTDSPDVTPCFQKTVLVWIPCGYLWLAAVLEMYQMRISKEKNIPRNKLNTSKLVFTLLLILLQIFDICKVIYVSYKMIKKVFGADYYDPLLKLMTFVLSATLMSYNRKCGIRTSGVQFMFWMLLIVMGWPQLRTETINYYVTDDAYLRYNLASYVLYYLLVIIMFVLNCIADLPPKNTPYTYDEKQSPENSSGVPSRLTFSWFDPIVLTGYRRTLTENDLWPLNPEDVSKESVAKFEKLWHRALHKRESSTKAPECRESFPLQGQRKENKPLSVFPICCKAFGGLFLVGTAFRLCNDVLNFASPELLRLLIGFVEGKEPVWRGYLYAASLFVCSCIQTVIMGQYFLKTALVGLKINCALSSMVYKKALILSNEAKKSSTVGEIINLMSTDITRFSDLTFINWVWSAPLQITLALYFLWKQLGPSVLAGLAVIVVLMPLNGYFAGMQKKLRTQVMKYKDERIKLMNEVLNGIKVLKIYAWEPSFQEYILKIRNREIKILKKIAYYDSFFTFLFYCTPVMISLMSFTCFVLVNDKAVLDSKRAFVTLSLFNMLRFPMSILPNVISDIIQSYVSLKRLNRFLNSEELDGLMIEHNSNETDQIVIDGGHFSWGGEDAEPVLKNLKVRIPRGALVAVVGAVGSGKSSLLAALLGEMDKLSGRVNVKGKTSYVAQQAWIQNATVQNNILFGHPYHKVKYNRIIEACALKTDLAILPGGDQTEIGEKGINLSGGQKQRVSLARAVYCDAENYFLDDPLSAVDSHVGKEIFDKVIGPKGLLKHKTRVWVTHNISYLAQTDLVLVLRDGEVSESGTYQQLLDKKGAFAEFLLHHLSAAEQNAGNDLKNMKQDLEGKMSTELHRKLQWARSLSSGARSTTSELTGEGDIDVKPSTEQMEENKITNKFDQLIQAEKAETGSVKWTVYKHYLSNIGVYASVGTLLTYMLTQSLNIGANFWLARWSNDKNMLINGTVDTQLRDQYLGVYGGISLAQALSTLFSNLLPFLACWRAAKILHEILLNNILRAPLHFYEVTPVGRILSRFSKDVDSVDTSLAPKISNALNFLFEVIGTLFIISYSTPMFIAVIIPIGLLYYAVQRFFVPTLRQLMRMKSIARSPIFSHFNESLLGSTSIRAFGVMDRFIKESQKKVDHYQSFVYLTAVANRWLGVRLQVVGGLIIFFAALFVVIGRDNINPGIAGLSISYTLKITNSLRMLVLMISSIETDIVAVERMKEYAETEQEAEWVKPTGPRPSWPETGSVQFEGLTMAYRSGSSLRVEPALRDLTCSVEPGDKLGIVGRTGAGKSTLTLGLFRILEPVGGRILIDGLDITKIGLHQLRTRITIIPQDPVLFSGSLRMNLDPFEFYSDDDIWRALELSHLKPFVLGLQSGLLHEVSEGGENLSVGQRQLVCLTRALLRKTPLLVLDEATAAIDLETDELIQKTIRSEFAACTVITIAHRLNTIMDSTKVMVLDKGQLIEYASPKELLQDKNSMFYGLAKDAGLNRYRPVVQPLCPTGCTTGLQSGLLHEVSEGGENLSVGQRQLVCLTRALLRKTPLLVLDEATAAIDLETDELIQKTIRSEFAACTVITIAHRLNTIMDSTKVMVLDKGQLIEYASPKELLQDKNSMFYGLAKDAGLVS